MSLVTPTISKKNLITTGQRHRSGKPVAIKAHQAARHHHMHRVVTDVARPTPNANSFNNGAQIKYFLEKDTLRTMTSVVLRFQIRMDDFDGTVVPTPYWFDRIEIHIRRNGEEVARYYNDILMMMLTSVSQEQSDNWAQLCGYDADTYLTSGVAQVAGSTKYYYLPMPAAVFEDMNLDFSTIDSDLEIRLHPNDSGILHSLVSVGANPQLVELAGVFTEEKPDSVSDNAHRMFLNKHVPVHHYLDSQLYTIIGQTMNPNNNYEFDLDQFDHHSACLVLAIRPTGYSNNDNTSQAFQSLGDGTIDMLGVSGESLYGAGRPIQAEYLKDIVVSSQSNTTYFSKVNKYVLSFGDLQMAFHGQINGVNKFDGSKGRLSVTTPSTWVGGSYEVSIYSLYFRTISQNGSDLSVKDL